MLHTRPSTGSGATDLKSELDRLQNAQPPDKADHLNNESQHQQPHQQLNQVYQRFQHHHSNNQQQQQQQHSDLQHLKEEAKTSKLRNSHSLTPANSQHLKAAAMQLNIAAHQHHHHHHHHHKQMYQKAYQQHVAPYGSPQAVPPTSAPVVDQQLLQSHPTTSQHQIPQSQPSKLPSSSSHNHHQQPATAELKFSSTNARESQPLHMSSDKQPFVRNQASSFARNQLLPQQLQETTNDLPPRFAPGSNSNSNSSTSTRQEQQERETNEMFAIDRQLDNLDLEGEGFKRDVGGEVEVEEEEIDEEEEDSKESDTLGSLEKNLPVELSFLIRQQAYCTAKMNYLERQIRELKEACQAPALLNNVNHNQTTPASQSKIGGITNRFQANNHHHHQHATMGASKLNHPSTTKNGNFIPSDDSGGEYSRATMSDDDELSSLLDQIAKSIRPDGRCQSMRSSSQFQQHELHHQQQLLHHPLHHIHPHQYHHNQQQQQQQLLHQHQSLLSSRVNFGVYGNPQQQAPLAPQQYAFINPGQLHHQAVPVFVMSSPITVAPHPSSINSSVPEVYFQPEPRYNQYYEDFYLQQQQQQQQNTTNPLSSSLYRQNGIRPRQFDGNLMATGSAMSEQIGAPSSQQQREKRQSIKSQLKSTDNWLKMRSSNLCNIRATTTNSSNDKNCDGTSNRQQQQATAAPVGDNSEMTTANQKQATAPTGVLGAATSVASSTAPIAATISSSAEAGSSSSTATEIENLNSVIEDGKR